VLAGDPAPTIARIANDLPPPIPAATVVVLRDGDLGLETLLLRRNDRGTFGGMWVFPGGRVDEGDFQGHAPDAEQAAARQAAVREAFEEAGLTLRARRLVPYAHWTPPPIVPKRFSTWFFITRAPSHEIVVDGAEVHEHVWLSPTVAISRHGEQSLALAPPTWVTLHQLTAFDRVSDALAAAVATSPERFSTRPLEASGVRVLTWHGDAAYDDGLDRDGPRHRLWMPPDTAWRYERTTP